MIDYAREAKNNAKGARRLRRKLDMARRDIKALIRDRTNRHSFMRARVDQLDILWNIIDADTSDAWKLDEIRRTFYAIEGKSEPKASINEEDIA